MATVTSLPSLIERPKFAELIPPLESGDWLMCAEFERRYDAMPHLKKAELIKGVVYMGSPVSDQFHGSPHFDLICWLSIYRTATIAIAGGDNSTLRLDDENEPQPDAFLRILAEFGGQARIDEDGYVVGGPEFAAEVAASSASYDLHDKLDVYRQHGVKEYLVWRVYNAAIDWFVLRGNRYERLALTADGLFKSEVLAGLWLDPAALMRGDMARVGQVAQQGLASPEHAALVARLQRFAASRPS